MSYRCRQQTRPSTTSLFVDYAIDFPRQNFLSPRFGTKSQIEVPQYLEIPTFPYTLLPLLGNCLTFNHIPFPSHYLPPQNSGPCNSFYCLGHSKMSMMMTMMSGIDGGSLCVKNQLDSSSRFDTIPDSDGWTNRQTSGGSRGCPGCPDTRPFV